MSTAPSFEILNRKVGVDYDPLIIAEIGINHGGDLKVAIEIADAAIDAGADIIKHQTHIIDDEMTKAAKETIPGNATVSIYDIMSQCALSKEEEYRLMEHVKSRSGIFISTPFSRAAANRLREFDIPCYKIGSGECNNYPLIEHIVSFNKPMIISTGMNPIESIKVTVDILETHNIPYALLHCTNVYPTPPELVRLGAISELQEHFPRAVVGLSDHTLSNLACVGAVATGAAILERHFTDSKNRVGPDIECSMIPAELRELKEQANSLKKMRFGKKGAVEEEGVTIDFAFSSVCSIKKIKKGDVFNKDNIWVKRPGVGDFLAKDFNSILNKKAARDIDNDILLQKQDIQDL